MSFHDPHRSLKLTLLLATLLHLALLIAAGGIAINLILADFGYHYGKDVDGDSHPYLVLVVCFWLCFLFSLPQIALLSYLLKRAASKRMATALAISTFLLFFLTLLRAALHTAAHPLQYNHLRDACSKNTRLNRNARLTRDVCQLAAYAKQFANRTYVLLALAWLAVVVAAGMLLLVGIVGWRWRKAGVKTEADSHAVERGVAPPPPTTTTASNLAAAEAGTLRSAAPPTTEVDAPCALHAASASHASHAASLSAAAAAGAGGTKRSVSGAHRKPLPASLAAPAPETATDAHVNAAAAGAEAREAPAAQPLHTHSHKHAESQSAAAPSGEAAQDEESAAVAAAAGELPAYTVDAPGGHGVS